MFTAIKINDENYKFKTGEIETEINGLNKINIFVGQNNSGKSRFMRSIFSNKIEFKDNINFPIDKWNLFITKIEELLNKFRMNAGDFNSIQQNINRKKIDYLSSYDEINTLKGTYKAILNNVDSLVVGGIKYQHKVDFKTNFDREIRNIFTEEDFDIQSEDFSKKVYIPMLRGLKNPIPNEFQKDIYKQRVIFDYFLDIKKDEIDFPNLDFVYSEFTKKGFDVFTGLSLYEDIKKMLLGTHEKRENIRDFEKFLSKNFFQNKIIVLTPNIEDDVLYVKIGDNSDLPIYDLGDGIQSIIINIFPLFKYKDENLLLFIEEPEIGIHPGMQRILLNTFAKGIQSEGKEHQIYFTTHSNHFLDIALEKEVNEKISVYQFKETENEKEKHITNISQNKEILDLLGVKNSSVFLSNCIIWVEGISDRIYIKKFLELYQTQAGKKKFEEDKHFSIIEYAGGNITHFNFGEFNDEDTIKVDAINKNNFIVADNDLETSGRKFDRLQELKSLVGSDNIYFDFPEIENLITYDIYKKYFDEQKGKNWQIKTSRCWTKSTFESNIYKKNIGTILKGTFIELIPGKTSDKFTNGNDISIIGKKDEIAERLIGFMENYLDLSPKAKELTQKLYKFIEKNNI